MKNKSLTMDFNLVFEVAKCATEDNEANLHTSSVEPIFILFIGINRVYETLCGVGGDRHPGGMELFEKLLNKIAVSKFLLQNQVGNGNNFTLD